MKKFFIIITAVLVVLIIVPAIINFGILIPRQWPVVGGPTEWLSFWATFIGAVASFGMIAFTYISLKQNGEQLNELKRQWFEDHRPNLNFEIIVYQSDYVLRIHNVGKGDAFNVKFEINSDFIERIDINAIKMNLQLSSPFFLEQKNSKYFLLPPYPTTNCHHHYCTGEHYTKQEATKWWENNCDYDIIINAEYFDSAGNKFECKRTLHLTDVPTGSLIVVDSELRALQNLIDSVNDIRKNLNPLKVKLSK